MLPRANPVMRQTSAVPHKCRPTHSSYSFAHYPPFHDTELTEVYFETKCE